METAQCVFILTDVMHFTFASHIARSENMIYFHSITPRTERQISGTTGEQNDRPTE